LTTAAGFFAILGATISSSDSEAAAFAALAFVEGFQARGEGFFAEALEGLHPMLSLCRGNGSSTDIIRNLAIYQIKVIEIASDEVWEGESSASESRFRMLNRLQRRFNDSSVVWCC
jgi:hypothetical protein